MAYQASLIFKEDLTSKGSKIPVGIHKNCKVKSIEKGEGFVDINFEDTEGRTNNVRLWQPKGNYPEQGESTEQAIARESRRNLSHIVKLMHIFLGEDTIKAFPELDYEPFIDRAIKELTPKLSTKGVNLKLIYDADGMYSAFGRYPNYVEEYVEGEEPKLTYSKWELDNRTTPKAATTAAAAFKDLL